MLFSFFRKTRPYNTGFLPEENGHQVFFHEFGNPHGAPILVFHGGPGSFSKAGHAELFDLKKHRVILFDQRGCGQSLPSGEIRFNTTRDLLHDAKRLLVYLGIGKTVVFGASWGATLALLFAETWPESMEKLILSRIFLARKKDADWLFSESGQFYPDIYAQLEENIPGGKSVRAHYAELALSDDEHKRMRATRLLGNYEFMVGSLDPAFPETDPTPKHISMFRLYMHYDSQDYGLAENEILENIGRIAHIPTLILHNRMDMICPVEQSWLVYKAMKNARLVIVPDYGHTSALLNKRTKEEAASFLS